MQKLVGKESCFGNEARDKHKKVYFQEWKCFIFRFVSSLKLFARIVGICKNLTKWHYHKTYWKYSLILGFEQDQNWPLLVKEPTFAVQNHAQKSALIVIIVKFQFLYFAKLFALKLEGVGRNVNNVSYKFNTISWC